MAVADVTINGLFLNAEFSVESLVLQVCQTFHFSLYTTKIMLGHEFSVPKVLRDNIYQRIYFRCFLASILVTDKVFQGIGLMRVAHVQPSFT
jgi:hypothetical protein